MFRVSLLSRVDDGRVLVVNADARSELTKGLEDLQELLMSNTVLVLLASWFSREERRELLVKVDEVLGVLPPLSLVLQQDVVNGVAGVCSGRSMLTVFNSDMPAHPRRT